MINAFKHAFVGAGRPGLLVVAYRAVEMSWRLTVSDNGIGTPRANWKRPRQSLDWAQSLSRHSPNSLTRVWIL